MNQEGGKRIIRWLYVVVVVVAAAVVVVVVVCCVKTRGLRARTICFF